MKQKTAYIVSDGRGQTGTSILRAASVQFPVDELLVTVRGGITSAEQVRATLEEAAEHGAVVFYTLVSYEARDAIHTEASRLGVPIVDLLGPSLFALRDLFESSPRGEPGLLYLSERERFDRQEAVDFTLAHDDGMRPGDLAGADVVLVGLSRVGKSATCFYLAYAGVKAANVPLIPNIHIPEELLSLPRERVIALTMLPGRLVEIRRSRALGHSIPSEIQYAGANVVWGECQWINLLISRMGWRRIDVTSRAIEETAREIMGFRGITRR